MTTPVRVRIAPSPTGEPHVGTAYVAVFNVLLARRLGGTMILRIEDTDQARSTADSEVKVLEALRWLDLNWSEGPDVGGPYGPYRQSERRDIYRGFADRLLADGHAFKCYCTRERLDAMRHSQRVAGVQPKYDGLCLHLTPEQIAASDAAGTEHVLRMKVPEDGDCTFTDGIFGEITIPWSTVDMQVLMKADGMPTYHLANVVDDHLMKITHVARGEEWLASVPKHQLLYRYIGETPPEFMHLPLLRNPDRSKLSKRRNPTSLSYYQSIGFLAEAMVNFLGLGFVTIAEGEELMTLDEMTGRFDPNAVGRSGAVFNVEKLEWLNARWIREKLDPAQFVQRVRDWAMANGRVHKALEMAQTRITLLGELPGLTGFLFASQVTPAKAAFAATKAGLEQSVAILSAMQPMVDTLPEWTAEAINEAAKAAAEGLGIKLRLAVGPMFLAMTGTERSLPLFESMALLGRSVVRQRLGAALKLLAQPD